MKKLRYIALSLVVVLTSGCEKFLDYPPEGAILAEDALNTPDDMQRLLNSCYDVLANVFDGSYQNMAELMSDNLAYPTGLDFQAIYNRETNFFTPYTGGVYADFYYTIYRCNTLLVNFDLIEGLSDAERQRMEAEARFIRALCHYYVAMIWSQPYGYSDDNSHLSIVIRDEPSNEPLARSSCADVFGFILTDLQYAYDNLPVSNGVYASKYAAAGLQSMVHFQMHNYQEAADKASEVLTSGAITFNEESIDHFPSNDTLFTAFINQETAFGIVSFQNDVRTEDLIGNYNSSGALPPALTLSTDFVNLMNSSGGDARSSWVDQDGSAYLCNKYAGKTIFNIPIIYATELKLIRAESLAEINGDLGVAIADINDIRTRAFGEGVNPLSESSSASEVIEAARDEYRKETVAEGKWVLQLKRIGAQGEDVSIRNAPWNCPGMALQFPNSEFTGASFVGNPEGGCQ
ncbi:MAG: hypothetical protein RL220_829 [Bacteroidota bacterium]|jgi:hypothetical protein